MTEKLPLRRRTINGKTVDRVTMRGAYRRSRTVKKIVGPDITVPVNRGAAIYYFRFEVVNGEAAELIEVTT